MNKLYVYVCIVLMAVVTYLIRMLPLAIFKKPIKNKFFRSFLFYAPYVTLSALTFPSIIYCTGDVLTASIGFGISLVCAFISESLPITALVGCLSVFIAQLI